jgi:hypothetical protein
MRLSTRELELKNFLASLPADKATKLALAVERGRLAGERGLPAELILDGLRPTLKRLGLRRSPTAQRLFCEPFADFLVEHREYKQAGRIARSTIISLWKWLAKEGLRSTLTDFEHQITRSVLARDTRSETELVHQLQAEAASIIHNAVERVNGAGTERRILAVKLGGEEALFDVEEIAVLLSAAGDLSPLRGLLPKRIDTLNDQHTALIRDIYEELSVRRPELCPYVGLLVLGRLKRPWEVLRLAAIMGTHTKAPLFNQSDIGLIGDILLADMENMALDIASVRPDTLDPDALLNKLDRFTQMSGGLVREIGAKREGKWGQRLIKIRQLASDAMDALIARSPREITAALPIQRLGAFGGRGPKRPDFAKDPDAMKVDRALMWGKLLAGSTPYAGGGDFHAAHKDAFEEVSNYLLTYTESIVVELRTLDFDKRPRAQSYLAHTEALSSAILGHEETEHIRRRVAAALAR